jgi:hypothetical protein
MKAMLGTATRARLVSWRLNRGSRSPLSWNRAKLYHEDVGHSRPFHEPHVGADDEHNGHGPEHDAGFERGKEPTQLPGRLFPRALLQVADRRHVPVRREVPQQLFEADGRRHVGQRVTAERNERVAVADVRALQCVAEDLPHVVWTDGGVRPGTRPAQTGF